MPAPDKGHLSRQWVEVPTFAQTITPTAGGQQYTRGGGWIYTLTGGTAQIIDLSTVDWNGPMNPDNQLQAGKGAADCYFTIRVSGVVPIYVCGYPSAALATANPPVSSGWTNGLQTIMGFPIWPIATTGPDPAIDTGRFLARYGVNHVLNMISTGTPTVFIYRSGQYANL